MDDCIFCKIAQGEIPSYKIYEDDDVYAFLSTGPLNSGHTLVIPKKHSHDALEMSADEFSILNGKISKIANSIKQATAADGMNIIFNSGSAAGQEVFHTHAHVVPRFKNDGYKWWPHGAYKDGEAEEVAEKIRVEI